MNSSAILFKRYRQRPEVVVDAALVSQYTAFRIANWCGGEAIYRLGNNIHHKIIEAVDLPAPPELTIRAYLGWYVVEHIRDELKLYTTHSPNEFHFLYEPDNVRLRYALD